MTALSIRRMHDTMTFKEQIVDAYYSSLKPSKLTVHYWHVERKAKKPKNGKKWLFVARFYLTKPQMAETWNKFYRGGNYRLVHMMKYSER